MITIEDVKKLKIAKDEYLLIRFPDYISAKTMDSMQAEMKKVFDKDFKRVVVYCGNIRWETVKIEKEEKRKK